MIDLDRLSETERQLSKLDFAGGPFIDVDLSRWAPLIGEVRAPNGQVMDGDFRVTPAQILEGVAWMLCPDCAGDPRGFCLPDDRFISCVRCRGRHVVPVSV
jgi:hypothetical protein